MILWQCLFSNLGVGTGFKYWGAMLQNIVLKGIKRLFKEWLNSCVRGKKVGQGRENRQHGNCGFCLWTSEWSKILAHSGYWTFDTRYVIALGMFNIIINIFHMLHKLTTSHHLW